MGGAVTLLYVKSGYGGRGYAHRDPACRDLQRAIQHVRPIRPEAAAAAKRPFCKRCGGG